MFAEPPPLPAPYRRSAFQVALLLFVSGGLYVFVWAYHVRRWCAAALERQDQPLWKSIALIVPIFNLFLMFDLGQMIKGVAWRAELRVPGALPWLGIGSFVIGALWRLPNPYWLLSLLSFIPLASMHSAFVRSEIALAGEPAAPTRFHWVEWIVIVVGTVFWLLASVGSMVPEQEGLPARAPWFPWLVAALAVVALIFFARVSRQDARGALAPASATAPPA